MTPENFSDRLGISVCMDQVAPDIWKYFKEHISRWQGEALQKLLNVAVHDGCEER